MSFTQDKNNRKDRTQLKTYFETGDRPTEDEFEEAIDSWINQLDDDIHAVDYKIGIGTDDPKAKLNVKDVGGNEDSAGAVRIDSNSTADDGNLRFGVLANDHTWVQSHGNVPFHINRLGNDTILNLLNGKVGIGTDNPEAKVEIVGDSGHASTDGILRIESDAKTADANLRFGVVKGSHSWIQSHDAKPLHINAHGNDTILNKGNHNVGIGTDSTDEKLTVKGSMSVHNGSLKGNQTTSSFQIFGNTNDKNGPTISIHGKDTPDAGWDTNRSRIRGSIDFIANNSHQMDRDGTGLLEKEKAFNFVKVGKNVNNESIWGSLLAIQKNGNIGINQYDPTNKLEINNGSGSNTGLKLTTGKGKDKILTSDDDGNGVWMDKTSVTNGLWKQNGNTVNIQNGNAGNVTIGTPPHGGVVDSKLEVAGVPSTESGSGILKLQGPQGWHEPNLRFGLMNTGQKRCWIRSVNSPLSINVGAQNVGIGLTDPKAKLHVGGEIRVSDYNIYLRGGTDTNHGIGFLEEDEFDNTAKRGQAIPKTRVDGPFVFGNEGGVLGSIQSGDKNIAMQWFRNKDVEFKRNINVFGESNFGGKVLVKGHQPFLLKRYYFRDNNVGELSGGRSLSVSSNTYGAAIVSGFSFDESDTRPQKLRIYLYTKIVNNDWCVFADSLNAEHLADTEKWNVDILFVKKELVGLSDPASSANPFTTSLH